MAYGCLHAPITHQGYFNWLIKQVEDFKPDVLVNLGDWYEGLAGSRHSRDPRHNWSLLDEHKAVAAQAEAINLAAPHALKVWLAGNHDDNAFGIHADRIPKDLRDVVQWRANERVNKALEGWKVYSDYHHGARFYAGQVSFGHGCPVTDASAKDEAYCYGVPFGLDIRAHTHRPEMVTQARERKVVLPYWYANTGTGADWDKMHYMDRQSKALWGRAMVYGELTCARDKFCKETYGGPNWVAETKVYNWANPRRDLRLMHDVKADM
jgi:3',5'-cyclic AMP phosphodiesterase CpdA